MSQAKVLMVQGCTSHAGKSYLTAGFCRLYANRGLKVMPFKAQNMSNNAGVTEEGLEIGRAQMLQAQAAKTSPTVHMNPVLLKPEKDTQSQVVVLGKARHDLGKMPWHERKDRLWSTVKKSLDTLRQSADLVIIEGAGSPAEINLKSTDIVNMAVAKEAGAKVLLVADIDRGGAFAHLLGTWHCLDPEERSLLIGFILNKFRGDSSLLGNAMDWLEDKTHVPTLGIVPMLNLPIPEEDSLADKGPPLSTDKPSVAIICLPYLSNFDEFDALCHESEIQVCFAKYPKDLKNVSAVILPGSKQVVADLMYLKRSGMAACIQRLAEESVPILGICGGMQMLGRDIRDPEGIEGRTSRGLALLDIETEMHPLKVTRQVDAEVLASGMRLSGYEIHHGRTVAGPKASPYLSEGLGYVEGNIMGVYVHGLFEESSFRAEFLQRLGVTTSFDNWPVQVDTALDSLANHLESHCDLSAMDKHIFS